MQFMWNVGQDQLWHCDAPLVNAMLDLDDGNQVQVSKCLESECSNYEGKIKSPLCCGNDMTCSL